MSITKKNITNRLYIVGFFLIVIVFFIVFKIIDLQFFKGDHLISISEKREFKNIEIPANRGNIYSDNGKLLATSVPKYEIRFDALAPSKKNFDKYVDQLADSIGNYYNEPPEIWSNRLRNERKNKNRYYQIAKNLGYLDYVKFKNFPLFSLGSNSGGFIKVQNTKRDYPIGGIAQRTLGYERYDDFGNVSRPGLDGAFGPKYLKGKNGYRFSQKIGQGQWKPVLDFNEIEPRDGYDLHTTLNIEIQDIAHHALLKQLEYFDAEHGCVVVMETNSGEIKAISNLGRTSNGKYSERRNYAVWESHEPGSTFKLMAMVRALEDKVIDTSEIIDTKNGIKTFYGKSVRDSKIGGYGKISAARAFEVSSNTALVQIINDNYKENPERFVDGLYTMKINEPLGLPILGEGKPFFTHPSDKKNWDGLDLPWMAFGYGIRLTPLQILTFYNAIANNGVKVKPRFIKEVRQFDQIIEKFETDTIMKSVCSIETVKKVKTMMKNVVEKKHGTAHNIYSKDFSMAGKTGTCQTEYWKSSDLYISSFAGYFPAEKPKYSCIVVIHKPDKTKGYYGNIVAAPVFKEIAEKIYSTTPVVESFAEKEFYHSINKVKQNSINNLENMLMPDISDYELMDIIPLLENLGCEVIIEGKGNNIEQSVSAGTRLKKGQKIKLKLI